MEQTLQISSAAATIEGPLEGDTGHGMVHLPEYRVFALAAGPDGRPSDSFAVRILTKALRIAFRPREGEDQPRDIADKTRLIRDAIRAAGEAILTQPAEKRSGGATLVALFFDDNDPARAGLIHVGDCRCYRFRNSRPERLTHALSAAQAEAETPLLMDVLSNAIGQDDRPEIEEEELAVAPGDAFALIPGSLFHLKPDQAVGRALRRVPNRGAALMAASLVEEALKTENTAGIALVVRTESPETPAPTPPPEPAEAEKPAPETPPEPLITASAAPVEEKAAEKAGSAVPEAPSGAPVGVDRASPSDEAEPAETPAEPGPDEAALAPLPAAETARGDEDESERKRAAPATREAKLESLAKRTTRKAVADETKVAAAAALPMTKPARPPPATAAPSKPAAPKLQSPLTRSPLMQANGEPQKTFPWIPVAALAAAILLLAGIVWLGVHLWHRFSSRSQNEAELQRAATTADVLRLAQENGQWDQAEKELVGLPPLAPDDEITARSWISFWRKADASGFTDAEAVAHVVALDALIAQVGGGLRPPAPKLGGATRADDYCRLVHAKQQQLAAAVQLSLRDLNKRADIPFPDLAVQKSVLAGLGQFTRGRYAQRLNSISGDFATARTSEGQLEAWLERRDMDRPQEQANLQRMPAEPLRLLGNSLDRAWEGLLDVATGTATDTAHWRKQPAAASLLPRLNRLDAVRQNIIADRKRAGDIHRWRMSGQTKQLAVWLLNETASLGATLSKPAPAAAPRRR